MLFLGVLVVAVDAVVLSFVLVCYSRWALH